MTHKEAIIDLNVIKDYFEQESGAYPVSLEYAIGVLKGKHIEADRPSGEWLWQLADNGWADHICSVCGYTKNTDIHVSLNWSYCPHCGSKMRGEHDD